MSFAKEAVDIPHVNPDVLHHGWELAKGFGKYWLGTHAVAPVAGAATGAVSKVLAKAKGEQATVLGNRVHRAATLPLLLPGLPGGAYFMGRAAAIKGPQAYRDIMEAAKQEGSSIPKAIGQKAKEVGTQMKTVVKDKYTRVKEQIKGKMAKKASLAKAAASAPFHERELKQATSRYKQAKQHFDAGAQLATLHHKVHTTDPAGPEAPRMLTEHTEMQASGYQKPVAGVQAKAFNEGYKETQMSLAAQAQQAGATPA